LVAHRRANREKLAAVIRATIVSVCALSVACAACNRGAAEPAPSAEPAAHGPAAPAPNPTTPAAPGATPIPRPSPPTAPAAQDDKQRAAHEAAEGAPLLTFDRTDKMMGTIIKIVVVGVEASKAAPVVDAALAEMHRLEGVLSEWRPDSEISRVNQAAGEHPVKVGVDTLRNVQVSNEVSKWSDGAFDLSWAALRDLYMFQPGQEKVPTQAELDARLPLINWRDIVVDAKKSTVFLKKKGMLLGTGGIAKGYALDRAAEILQKGGLSDYMIFGGGQVLVHGKKGDRLWRVGIQHPRMDDYFAFLELTDASISTSGDYEHAFFKDGKRWHHIIDLSTGRPVEHTTSVTVVCSSGFYGDAVDTAMFIMGADKTLKKLDGAPGPKMDVLIVDADMRVHMSKGMEQHVVMRMPLQDGKLPMPR
jgi:thiamine biosynthesis lipoprotein